MQKLENNTNTLLCTLYQSWIVRFKIWNSWIETLYLTSYSYVSILYLTVLIIYLYIFVYLTHLCLCFLENSLYLYLQVALFGSSVPCFTPTCIILLCITTCDMSHLLKIHYLILSYLILHMIYRLAHYSIHYTVDDLDTSSDRTLDYLWIFLFVMYL